MPDEPVSACLRLFLAIAVPPAVCGEIARAQDQLRRHSPPGAIRWTRPDQFHLTLKFLGDVLAGQVDALKASVATVCAGFPALQLSADGLGFFPGVEKPRVVWTGTREDTGRLADLQRQLEAAMQPFAPTEKAGPFTGHITLGRFKPGHHTLPPRLMERVTMLPARHFGDWLAGSVELVRSELTATGARHTPLASFPLGALAPQWV